jgi:hypothetical protein
MPPHGANKARSYLIGGNRQLDGPVADDCTRKCLVREPIGRRQLEASIAPMFVWECMHSMGTDGKVISCEFAGCPRRLEVGPDLHRSEVVKAYGDWAFVRGMVLCPQHAEHGRPWLS